MKKKLLLLASCAMMSTFIFAQKTQNVTTTTAVQNETTYQYTQARKPQVWVEPLVKPLIVEVEVMKDVPQFKRIELARRKVETELEGKLENIYNYGIFLYTADTNSDMIVAATYNFYTNPKRTGDDDWYILEIKGFPAKFKEWRTAKQEDYEWMRIQSLRSINKQDVFEKVSDN